MSSSGKGQEDMNDSILETKFVSGDQWSHDKHLQ